jgi:MYXO-CTERM domain-containing protein
VRSPYSEFVVGGTNRVRDLTCGAGDERKTSPGRNLLDHRFVFRALVVVTMFSALLAPAAVEAAEVVLWIDDEPGSGFNSTQPAAPVGGNTGTTVGEQRAIAFLYAVKIWATQLESDVPIVVQADFKSAFCSGNSALLGWAGADSVHRDFAGAPFPSTYYHAALADSLAGHDLDPDKPDVFASFNSALDRSDCLGGRGWYYGLDGDHGTDIDLVQVVSHEFGHGIGFSNFVDETSGSMLGAQHGGDIFARFTYDVSQAKYWSDMTDSERAVSATNTYGVVWDGPSTKAEVRRCLDAGSPSLWVGGNRLTVVPARFGSALPEHALAAVIEEGRDGSGDRGDGCQSLDSLAGKIALLHRSSACQPEQQAMNAQRAGAIAAVLVSDSESSPPGIMGGSPEPDPTIPAVQISRVQADLVVEYLGESVSLLADPDVYIGADQEDRVMLYAPSPVRSGSSISHFDTMLSPSGLMEPFATPGLPHRVDLAMAVMEDIGWETDPIGDPCASTGIVLPPPQIDAGSVASAPAATSSQGAGNASTKGCSAAASGTGSRSTAALFGLVALGLFGFARRRPSSLS